MMYVTRLTEAEQTVIVEAMLQYEAAQTRIARRTKSPRDLAEARWREYVARQLREQITLR